jgi:serine/threonine protein kinase
MTFIRRPARVTHSCPVPGSDDFWDCIVPSRRTMLRAESTRRCLEDHFNSIIEENKARHERFEQFNLELDHQGVSAAEREELTKQFLEDESQIARASRSRLKTARFQRIKLIGRGGFGHVYLVQDKISFDLFALKVLSKADVISRDQISNVRAERDILSQTVNPWVVGLKASFQDDANLYLVLEYLPGGDLMTALMKRDVFPTGTARFFAGEIALALKSIHLMNVIHRDLKPDNVLIGEDGHIKLTDFGLSTNYRRADTRRQEMLREIRELMGEQFSPRKATGRQHHVRDCPVGTCNYTAPEVIRGEPPTEASDYWSFGVILFEMLFGYAPFAGKSTQETLLRILHWQKALRFPRGATPEAVDIIRHLICAKEQRFGFEQIAAHPFCTGFNFVHVEMNHPPMVPVLTHPMDTNHFDEIVEEAEPGPEMGEDEDLARMAFMGFTYKQRPRNMTLARLGIF